MVGRLAAVAVLTCTLMVSGCSSVSVESSFHYLPAKEDKDYFWPIGGEVTRYRFVGDLIGEDNIESEYAAASGLQKFWQFLVGDINKPPLVLQRPQGVAVAPSGRIYVADVSAAAIVVFDPVNATVQRWDSFGDRIFVAPVGLAVSSGKLFVTDSEQGRVLVLDGESGELLDQFGDGIMHRPTGIAVADDLQKLFVTDSGRHLIQKFDLNTFMPIGTIGQRGVEPGQFNGPTYLAYHEGSLLVSDTLNARVQRLDLDSGRSITIGRRGAKIGNLTRPKGVAYDSENNIYVIESYFDHLLVYNQTGDFLLPVGGSGHGPGQFFLPSGIAVDQRDRIYISDMMNGRVSVFQFLGAD